MSLSTASTGADGPVYRLLSRGYELVLLSVVWWLLSLPVVTAPAATDWLVDGVRRTGRGERIRGVVDTLRFMASRARRTTALGAVHVGVLALLLVGALGPSPGGPVGAAVLIAVVAVGATWALLAPWSVVLLADLGVRDALRTAYLRALRHLSHALLSAVTVIAAVAALLLAPDVVRLPLLLVLPGLVVWALTRLCHLARPHLDPRRTRP